MSAQTRSKMVELIMMVKRIPVGRINWRKVFERFATQIEFYGGELERIQSVAVEKDANGDSFGSVSYRAAGQVTDRFVRDLFASFLHDEKKFDVELSGDMYTGFIVKTTNTSPKIHIKAQLDMTEEKDCQPVFGGTSRPIVEVIVVYL